MKHVRGLLILTALLAVLTLYAAPAAAQPDYIRLHIVAASDSAWDQSVKLCVRDAIRIHTRQLLADCADADAAWQLLEAHREELLAVARDCAMDCGYDGPVALETGVYPFPDRTYGDELVPAGDYRAIRILLGEGAGHNWWCVVYPSLCLPEDADVSEPVQFYSEIHGFLMRLWEVIRS